MDDDLYNVVSCWLPIQSKRYPQFSSRHCVETHRFIVAGPGHPQVSSRHCSPTSASSRMQSRERNAVLCFFLIATCCICVFLFGGGRWARPIRLQHANAVIVWDNQRIAAYFKLERTANRTLSYSSTLSLIDCDVIDYFVFKLTDVIDYLVFYLLRCYRLSYRRPLGQS